jgi:hypothetical protein
MKPAANAVSIPGHEVSDTGIHTASQRQNSRMKIESTINILTGAFVLVSIALARWVDPNWLWLAIFLGANLLQSGFTGWCFVETVLRRLGAGRCRAAGRR